MSFGGSVSAMISSLKNNARAKRKTYFDRDISFSNKMEKSRNALLDKKATPKQLNEIRKSLIKENRKERNKNLTIIVIATALIISVLLLFNY